MNFFLMYLYALIDMKKQRTFYLIIILITLTFGSCKQGSVYHEYITIEGANWYSDSVLHYEVVIEDSISLNDFYINIRNNTDYPFSNLYLFLTTEFPNGHSTRDTIECILADKNGKWLGSGSGRIKDNKIMLQQALRFPLRGTYHFYLEQGMRHEQLKGIEDIGFSIEANRQ
ncbi:MAG: gliding motility lipoprotein GldH [Bacteroidales bacterium]|nr:gliding motility lipoprotein GldH [Bacteroidales bacterium]